MKENRVNQTVSISKKSPFLSAVHSKPLSSVQKSEQVKKLAPLFVSNLVFMNADLSRLYTSHSSFSSLQLDMYAYIISVKKQIACLLSALQRQWDSLDQTSSVELLQDCDIRWAVKRLFSGNLQLPKLSCRSSAQDGPPPVAPLGPATYRIKHSRSYGTLTSCMSRGL